MFDMFRAVRTVLGRCTIIVFILVQLTVAGEDIDPQIMTTALKGTYLEQTPPGEKPVVFGEGVISTSANEHGCAFTPDGFEFYFTRIIEGRPTIMVTRQELSGWTDPEVASFSGRFNDRLPSISPDGQKLFFHSIRPWPDSTGPLEHHAWFVRRDKSGWGPAEPLPLPINRTLAGISAAANGRLYVGGIISLDLVDGRYVNPQRLDPRLDGDYPYVAPDESFVLFCAGRQRNLAVSYRTSDSAWSQPRMLTDIPNTYWMQGFPIISPCGRYVLFTANHNIYWVDAEKFMRENLNSPHP